jgi:cystathionine beta-lyase
MSFAAPDQRVERRRTGSTKWDRFPDDVLPLWVADMDFPSPPSVVAALESRAAHGVYGYQSVQEPFVDALRGNLLSRYAFDVSPDWLVWLPGVVSGLNLACEAYASPGDEVLTIAPAYPPFLRAPSNQGRRLVTVGAADIDGRWRLPMDELEEAVTDRTRLLLLCHPHNPLGRVWDGEELRSIVALCERRDLVLCSDEIHCDLVLDDMTHEPVATLGPAAAARTVTFMSPSKTFNLPGLNFAFAVIPDEELRRRFCAAAEGLLPHPGCFAVAAAEAAYRDGEAWLSDLLDYLRANRELLERFVAESMPATRMNHVEGTYLGWLDVRAAGLDDPWDACLRAGVALGDGVRFGAPGFLRLNFACWRSTLAEALQRLRPVLSERRT